VMAFFLARVWTLIVKVAPENVSSIEIMNRDHDSTVLFVLKCQCRQVELRTRNILPMYYGRGRQSR
jgi:hypothetical protein